MSRPNVFADGAWDLQDEELKINSRFVGWAVGANELGMSVHDLLPGSAGFDLHYHYGMEELFVVLSGRPTLRTGSGEEELGPGDVVSMPRGICGLHTFANPTEEHARVLAISTALPSPEVVVHPEVGTFCVTTRHPLAPAHEHGDAGIIATFDLPSANEE